MSLDAGMNTEQKIDVLKLYLKNVPKTFPLADMDHSLSRLLFFAPDTEWVEEIGEEAAVNRGLETALFSFGPRNDAGIFKIDRRGPNLEALADVLQTWLRKYPDSFYLKRWLDDSIASAQHCMVGHPEGPVLSALPTPSNTAPTESTSVVTPSTSQTVIQATLPFQSDKTIERPPRIALPRPKVKKTDTKILPSSKDPDYTAVPENIDERQGGRKTLQLLLRVSERCRRNSKGPDAKTIVRCAGSSGCKTTWAWPRDKTRILKHVVSCSYVAQLEGGSALVTESIEELAKKNPDLIDELTRKLKTMEGGKREREEESRANHGGPSLKRHKTEPTLSESSTKSSNKSTMAIYQTEGRKNLEKNANKALVEFLICCGVPPNVLSAPTFQNFVSTLNNHYHLPKRSTLEDSLVPTYAAAVKVAILKHLKESTDLNISFDGGKATKKKFYSVHVTDVKRRSFCLELDDVSRISQSGEYIRELLKKWIIKIGPHHFCGMASDDAANCNKGRRLIAEEFPHILDMPDACHNLHNTCKDICNLPEFKPAIAKLRELLAFMSQSTYTNDFFDLAREELSIKRGLQSIGETRFATIYWSLNSVLEGFPAFVKIASDYSNGIESEIVHSLFDYEETAFDFKSALTRLGAVIMPIARAIQCLEAKEINPSDVYLYWLAVVAQLKDLLNRDQKRPTPQYSPSVVEDITRIANYRFGQLINNKRASNIYLSAFFLDPSNRGAVILSDPNPLAVPSLSSSRSTPLSRKNDVISGIGLSLQTLLRHEYGNRYRPGQTIDEAQKSMHDFNPRLSLRSPQDALTALRIQLKAYTTGSSPFDRKRGLKQSQRDWWVQMLDNPESDVLAALSVKIFSAVPTSMVDERAMSTVTWLNSSKRNRQAVSTLSDHLAIRDFHKMNQSLESRNKPVTVNWRDMRKTIYESPTTASAGAEPVEATSDAGSSGLVPDIGDRLAWLDEDLPDLSTAAHHQFDLAREFDIKRYLDVLADSAKDTVESPGSASVSSTRAKNSTSGAPADSVVPMEEEWNKWEI